MSLTMNSFDLVAKASSILGFNIFLQQRSAPRRITMRVVALAAQHNSARSWTRPSPPRRFEATAHLE
jgi:hypothetical protein